MFYLFRLLLDMVLEKFDFEGCSFVVATFGGEVPFGLEVDCPLTGAFGASCSCSLTIDIALFGCFLVKEAFIGPGEATE